MSYAANAKKELLVYLLATLSKYPQWHTTLSREFWKGYYWIVHVPAIPISELKAHHTVESSFDEPRGSPRARLALVVVEQDEFEEKFRYRCEGKYEDELQYKVFGAFDIKDHLRKMKRRIDFWVSGLGSLLRIQCLC